MLVPVISANVFRLLWYCSTSTSKIDVLSQDTIDELEELGILVGGLYGRETTFLDVQYGLDRNQI
jgi:hypothetical protein